MIEADGTIKPLFLDNFAFGEILRAKREELKLEISDVSAQLRVKPADIEAIEQNRLRRIARHIYAPGFIRTYAKFLRIDNKIIEEQLSLLRLGSNVEDVAHVLMNLEEEDNLSPSKSWSSQALVAAALLILVFFVTYNFCASKGDLITNKKLMSQLNSAFTDEK